MSSERDVGKPETGVNRRSFFHNSGGIAAGLAAVTIPPAALAAASPAVAAEHGVPAQATGDAPDEPIMAYVHDAEKGIVTVVSGATERTYRDPALTKRLLKASQAQTR